MSMWSFVKWIEWCIGRCKNEGIGGLTRLGLTKMVENGYMSIDTAAKVARGTDAVMNIAQT